jgi:23S rRNA (uracil1939-C5)-methyltransferase
VRGGIAGELVRAEILEDRGHFARARVIEVLEPSPDRVQPRCLHFGFESASCGGCTWQHIDYAAQLRFKTEIVREQFRRIGRIPDAPVRETYPSPDVWAYRSHAQFSVASDGRLGFQAARSNRIVPIDVCYVVQPPILEWLRSPKPASPEMEQVDVRVSNTGDGLAVSAGSPTSGPRPPVSDFRIKGVSFHISAGSFFQVNTSLIGTLVDQVMARLNLHGGETVLDAYCGVGLFSRFLAPVAGRVIGIESSPSAVADARVNLAQFDHIDLRAGLVEEILPALDEAMDAAVVDPPRSGCGPKVIQALTDRRIERLVYVSCDPATLARDARQLMDGGYGLIDVQPLDMFPHTFHIETVSTWIRAS